MLRSALRWAVTEGLLSTDPIASMRGPRQPGTRLHVPANEVRALLRCAEADLTDAEAAARGRGPWTREMGRLHRAEQVLLVLRLAADSGARRGELAALRWSDLDGPALTISRGTSNEVVGPTKTGRIRRLTLGSTTVQSWQRLKGTWRRRATTARSTPRRGGGIAPQHPSKKAPFPTPDAGNQDVFGPWVFSRDPLHRTRLTTSALGHWFGQFTKAAGYPDVTLHRLRHSVATALVSQGDILGAQQRLGHADAHTTLRIYSHAQPLADLKAAALLDHLYVINPPRSRRQPKISYRYGP
jgi:integrase